MARSFCLVSVAFVGVYGPTNEPGRMYGVTVTPNTGSFRSPLSADSGVGSGASGVYAAHVSGVVVRRCIRDAVVRIPYRMETPRYLSVQWRSPSRWD